MTDGLKLACVDPMQIDQFWPHVWLLLKRAMDRGRIAEFSYVEHSLRNGSALLWIAWDGKKIKAAAVTELSSANKQRFCTIVACGGEDREQWLGFLGDLENYAKTENCVAMRIYGRRGWQRLLPDYKPARVLLEKELI